jgi:hypothetical protein
MGHSADPILPDDDMAKIVNDWTLGTSKEILLVEVGVAGEGRPKGTGLIAIRRTYLNPYRNPDDVIAIPKSGALRITKAPIGRRVVPRAIKRANLQFISRRGVHGTLHLADDSVTIKR